MSDLVVISLEDWDEVWRRNQYLVACLLREDPALRVLFVGPPADPLHELLGGARPHRGHPLQPVTVTGVRGSRLWSCSATKWFPRALDPRADRRLAGRVLRACRRLGFQDPVLWINDPAGAELARLTGWRSLYDVTDDWLAAARPRAEHERLAAAESFLLARCAAVVVCSPRLAEAKGRGREVVLIPNAVDVSAYRGTHERPADLPAGRIGLYTGTLHRDRLDVELCEATARALDGQARLVLLGPDLLAEQDHRRLVSAGAVVLGTRPTGQLPAYLQHADANLVPHVVNAFTDSLDPIKLYEYRAAGRPVVSTPVAGFRDEAEALIVDAAGFPDAVRTLLTGPAVPTRPRAVPDWSNRAAAMAEVLMRMRGS